MRVTIGGSAAEIIRATATSITVRIPADPRDGSVSVITRVGSSPQVANQISILGAPKIIDFSPGVASPGEIVEIVGENFDLDQKEHNIVTFGGTVAVIDDAIERNGQTVLRVRVPNFIESSEISTEIAVKTPAVDSNEKGASQGGFQLKPIIESISPKRGYVGDPIVIRGRGLMRDLRASATGGALMTRSGAPPFSRIGDQQEIGFIVPAGAQSGPINVTQQSGISTDSRDVLEVNRIDELRKSELLSARPFTLQTSKGSVVIRLECDKDLLTVTDVNGVPAYVKEVGKCPIDIDVDPSTNHAFTANSKAMAKEGISEVDLSDPGKAQFIRYIDSGGANPTRIKVMRGGQIVAATGQGVYSGNAGGMGRVAQGRVVALLGDGSGEKSYVAVISDEPAIATVIGAKGEQSRFRLGKEPKSAVQVSNKIYVANYGSDNLSSLDPYSKDEPKQIPLGAGAKPFDIAVNPQKPELLVSESGKGTIGVLNVNTDTEVAGIAIGGSPTALAVSPNGCLALVYDQAARDIIRISPARYTEFGSRLRLNVEQPVIGFKIDQNLNTTIVLADGLTLEFLKPSCP
jgi:YVTN family beta-propeller protein